MSECKRCAETAGIIWDDLCQRCHQNDHETQKLKDNLRAFVEFLSTKGISLDHWKHCSEPGTRDVSPVRVAELIDEFMKEVG